MIQQVNFFGWALQIDYQATQSAYDYLPTNWDCTCSYCRNFRAALPAIPEAFRTALQDLGINLLHPAEAIEYPGSTNNLHLYEAWCHAVGHITTTPSLLLDTYGRREIVSGVEVRVSDKLALLPDNFPMPAVQIEFFIFLPWVIDEGYE